MKRNLRQLADGQYDVLVIGGGITGACIAHDAALRGLSVALVEKNDFGAFTSSASSKLLHGGIRYLPRGQVWKVRESAREQAIFQHLAPHLTRWIPFLVPTDDRSVMKGKLALKTAMQMYKLCCLGLSGLIHDPCKLLPAGPFLSARQALIAAPSLSAVDGLTGAQVLWESHMYNSERMTLAFVKTAAANGAVIANHLEVTDVLVKKGRVLGLTAKDRLGSDAFRIQAKLVINSAGPYVQAINSSIPELQLQRKLTGFSKGVHLVTRQIEPEYAMALTTRKKTEGFVSRGGRHFFIIPWRGRSIIGTTNVPYHAHLDDIKVTAQDVEAFLTDINSALPEVGLDIDDVRYSFAGIYPLVARDIKTDTYQGTGDYQVIDHQRKNGVEGMITALGSKFTTARYVAQRCIDLVMKKLGRNDPGCLTVSTPLLEGNIPDLKKFRKDCRSKYAGILQEEAIDHLMINHGQEIHSILDNGRKGNLLGFVASGRKTLDIEIDHAVRHEMALTLEDVIFQRTGLGTVSYPGDSAVHHCAELMGDILNWDHEERQRQIASIAPHYQYTR